MDTVNNNDEMIEELNDAESNEINNDDIVPDKIIDNNSNDIMKDESTNQSLENTVILEDSVEALVEKSKPIQNEESFTDGLKEETEEKTYETVEQTLEEKPKKSKMPLLVLLSVLLVLDIAILVIYMIGIEKVISFIK